MSLFTHELSDTTLALIERLIEATDGHLVIYSPHNWAVEGPTLRDIMGMRSLCTVITMIQQGEIKRYWRLAFDPMNDSEHLQEELRRGIVFGF